MRRVRCRSVRGVLARVSSFVRAISPLVQDVALDLKLLRRTGPTPTGCLGQSACGGTGECLSMTLLLLLALLAPVMVLPGLLLLAEVEERLLERQVVSRPLPVPPPAGQPFVAARPARR